MWPFLAALVKGCPYVITHLQSPLKAVSHGNLMSRDFMDYNPMLVIGVMYKNSVVSLQCCPILYFTVTCGPCPSLLCLNRLVTVIVLWTSCKVTKYSCLHQFKVQYHEQQSCMLACAHLAAVCLDENA